MNAHPRAPSPAAVLRIASRVPLAAHVLPIVGAFLCSYLLYGRVAGEATALDWSVLGGLATSFLLFAVLRLVDDLDDLERDRPPEQCTAAERSTERARLLAGLAACVSVIVLLNLGSRHALAAAIAACALAVAAPFVFKRLFPRSLAVGSIVFEGAPLLVFAYGYFFWRDAGGPRLQFMAAACIVVLFWTGYEFWKFSRKVHSTAMQPYFLSPRGIRTALSGFLVLAAAVNLILAGCAAFSTPYEIYSIALPVAWLMWLNASWPAAAGRRDGARRPLWAGMALVGALEAGLLAELLAPFPIT